MLAPLFDFVLAGVEDHEVGSASGVLNAIQQLGGATGIAVLGTVFFSVGTAHGLGVAFERVLGIEAGVLVVVAALGIPAPHARARGRRRARLSPPHQARAALRRRGPGGAAVRPSARVARAARA